MANFWWGALNIGLLVSNGIVVTNTPLGVVDGGAVFIEGDRIVEVGRAAELDERYARERRLDAGGRLVTPGLINAHTHLYSTFARGMPPPDTAPIDFKEVLERIWWRLDLALDFEDLYPSAVIPLCDSLHNGVTTVFDHHASPAAIDGCLDEIARAYGDVGVRGVLCYEVSDRHGLAVARAGVRENARFLQQAGEHKLLRAMMGLHASFTLSDETLEGVALEAAAHGAGVHVHVAEDRIDQEETLQRCGLRVVERFEQHGLLTADCVLAHGVHLDEAEVVRLAERGAALVHNPQSNANNAVGWGLATHRLAAGVKLAIGTDGMTSAVLDDVRMAVLMARHELRSPSAAWSEIEQVFLEGNPRLASSCFDAPLGVLSPKALADVVVWDYTPPTPVTAESFFAHALFGLTQAGARDAIVGGNLSLHEGQVLRVDERAVRRRATERARALWQRL